jgi:hypothetical protein
MMDAYANKTFQFDPNLRYQWPHEDFLKFHNECFEAEMTKLQGAADEYDSDQDDSNETVAVVSESIKKSEEWLTLDEPVSA